MFVRQLSFRMISSSSSTASAATAATASSTISKCPVHSQQQSQQPQQLQQNNNNNEIKLKPFSEIPQVPTFGYMFGLFTGKYDIHKPYTGWKEWHDKYGDTVRLNLLGQNIIIDFNPNHWSKIYATVGK
jgi:hypothetical protein